MRYPALMVLAMITCSCSAIAGKDGTNGTDGLDGKDGAQGQPGAAGKDAVTSGDRLKPIYIHGDDGTRWPTAKFADEGLGGMVCTFKSEILGVPLGGIFCVPPDMPVKDPDGQFADGSCSQPLTWNPSGAAYILSDTGKIYRVTDQANKSYWMDLQTSSCKPSLLGPDTLAMYWKTEMVASGTFVEGVEATE